MAEIRAGEGWAWAFGVLGLLGLAVPVGMFSDLPLICGLAATAPGVAVAEDSPAPTIVWLELAGLAGDDRPEAVRAFYKDRGYLGCARKAVVCDSLFLVFYGGLLSIAALLVARGWRVSGWPKVGRAFRLVVAAVVLAAALDLAENLGMLRMLAESPRMELAGMTALCSLAKFILLGWSLGAIAVGGVPLLFRARKETAGVAVLAGLTGVGAAAGAVWLVTTVAGAWNSLPAPLAPS